MDKGQLIRMETVLREALSPERLVALGREVKFAKRLRAATPDAVASALITAMATRQIRTIADLHRFFVEHTGQDIHYKPLHLQLSKPEFSEFMARVLGALLGALATRVLRPLSGSVLGLFDDIVLQDGTSHAVHDGLAERFPGRFKANRPAAIELHATMSLLDDQVLSVALAPDVAGERDFLPEPADLTGNLLLADRGYQDIAYCARLTAAAAFFIMRATLNLNPVAVSVQVNGRDIRQLRGVRLKELRRKLHGKDADLRVWWARKGEVIEHRLVLLWNPRTDKHTLLLTNLAEDAVTAQQVGQLYRLRWQVELMFKEWRSFANLHRFNTRKEPILEGLLWASLAAALLKRFMTYAAGLVFNVPHMSTMRAATTGLGLLADLLCCIAQGTRSRNALAALLHHLARYARRAHPKRDKRTGRAHLGLCGAVSAAVA